MCMSKRIKERRTAMGYTQEELASKLNLQKSAIAKYENGRVENIKRSTIEKMAQILECRPSYLMGWDSTSSIHSTSSISISQMEEQIIIEYRKADDITKAMVLRALSIDENLNEKGESAKMA